MLLAERVGPCAYILSRIRPWAHLCAVGYLLFFLKYREVLTPHVNFCLEVLRIFLVTFFRLSIRKFHNDEDEMSLPSLVKKGFDHV